MATQFTELIDRIGNRVRDPLAAAHGRTFVLELLGRMSQVLNARQQYIQKTCPITLTAGQALYTVESDLAGILDIIDVRVNDIPIPEITPWRNLNNLSATWMSDRAVTPQGFARIGRSLLVIYPTPETALAIKVIGSALIDLPTAEAETSPLREEDEDIVVDMVSSMLLLRSRDLDTSAGILQRIVQKLRLQADNPELEAITLTPPRTT